MADTDTAGADFDTALNARLARATPASYVSRMHQLIEQLDSLKSPQLPTSKAEYHQLWAIKSALSGLSCDTFNSNHPRNSEVWDLEAVYGRLMQRYNHRFLISDSVEKQVANYVLCERHFIAHHERAFRSFLSYLAQRDRLRWDPDIGLCIIGLYKKVGDNVFSSSENGRHHRQYAHTTGRQAFPVASHLNDLAQREFAVNVPALDGAFQVTYLGDGKNRARHPKLTRAAYEILQSVR